MKKVLKKVVICIAILYFIASLLCNIYLKGVYTEQLNALKESNQTTMTFAQDVWNNRMILFEKYQEKLNIINTNLIIMLITSIVGIIVGLIISVKENSKAKYFLYFIFGNIIFNLILTVIFIIIHNKINTFMQLSFIRTYINTTIKTILPYIVIYILILYAYISNNKEKVKELNATLKNENSTKKFKINKNILIGLITIVVMIVVIFTTIIVRRTVILIKYSKAINEIEKTKNYFVKTENKITQFENNEVEEIDNYIKEFHYKDGVSLEKEYGENKFEYTIYRDGKQTLRIYKESAILEPSGYMDFERSGIYNNYYGDTFVRTWQNITLAFNVSIKKVEYNKEECYRIERKNREILYVDCKTYIPKGVTTETNGATLNEGNLVNCKTISDKTYTITVNTVTDEDVKKPDLTGIEVKTIEEINRENAELNAKLNAKKENN